MKKILFIIYCFFYLCFNAQVLSVDYSFNVYNKDLQKTFVFPANLQFEIKSQIKLYKVQFGIVEDENTPENYFASKKKPLYLIYTRPNQQTLILENIPNVKEIDYVFNDDYDMKWILFPESKIVNGIKLHKAETDFRGRHYIAWYDERVKIPVGPWKFIHTPGLIYEVSDEKAIFKWTLLTLKNTVEKGKNILESYTGEVVSFRKYPELRYALTPELKEQFEKIPNNHIFEQERNGLEIKFEWEK